MTDATMRALGQLLDRVLNEGSHRRREGFILLRFPHDQVAKPLYISTCPDADTIKILKLMLAQLEGRLSAEEGHA